MILLATILLGVAVGARTFSAPAALAWRIGPGWVAWLLTTIALAELVGDKLPRTPNRNSPPALAGRVVSGALCGWFLASAFGTSPVAGLVITAATAFASTELTFRLRRAAARRTGWSQPVLGLLEDGAVILVLVIAIVLLS